jgi:hypothetical protein
MSEANGKVPISLSSVAPVHIEIVAPSDYALAHLNLTHCSSEDEDFPATNLQGPKARTTSSTSASILTVTDGWVSEKFCEYPQELIFSINRGIPTRIHQVRSDFMTSKLKKTNNKRFLISQLRLLSHHCKIASRIEVFVSDATRKDWKQAKFQRLGFVTLKNNEEGNFSARELKTININSQVKLTLLRIVLHTCHKNLNNLFNQVGLVSFEAIEGKLVLQENTKQAPSLQTNTAPLPQPTLSESNGLIDTFANLKIKYHPAADTFKKSSKKNDQPETNVLEELMVWTLDKKNCTTVHFLLAQLAQEKEKSQANGDENLFKIWHFHEQESLETCNKIIQLSTQLYQQQNGDEVVKVFSIKSQIEELLRSLGSVATKLHQRATHQEHLAPVSKGKSQAIFQKSAQSMLQTTSSSNPTDTIVNNFSSPTSINMFDLVSFYLPQQEAQCTTPEVLQPIRSARATMEEKILLDHQSENWQLRVQALQRVLEHINSSFENEHRQRIMHFALSLVKSSLEDKHPDVFALCCSILNKLLVSYEGFKSEKCKEQLTPILEMLLGRLDDKQAVIRNNSSMSILRVADCTQAGGAFVVNFILKQIESRKLNLTELVFYASLKVNSCICLEVL